MIFKGSGMNAGHRKLLIFGAGEYAEVASYYFNRDAGREIAAFVVDDAFVTENRMGDIPVVPWSEAVARFPPSGFDVFVAIGYSRLNRLRVEKAATVKDAGYRLASFLHSKAIAWDGFRLCENTFILEHNTLQPFTEIGGNVVLWSGNHIGHHSRIDDGCFIASHVVVAGGVRIGAECFIGINATLRDHISVGRRNVIGAGAVILADTRDDAVFAATATPMSSIPSNRLRRI
jgi:sugar O-acyltransferase (sialic acid O-acetyltransferase NeuD family)